MRDPVTAYVGLGANLGDPVQAVLDAITRIAELPHTSVIRESSLYRTAPIESTGPHYINAVVEISTSLPAPELLEGLQEIEAEAGRQRPYRNSPRTLDLDLLLYGNDRIDTADLQVPHPRMNERAFVLVPLAEIASHLVSADQLAAVAGQELTPI
jgi:2-amino-4-hydroxy-6-hydroxymethyldihydropteridine diphosphokinase